MKEYPISFSTPMVQAIIEGKKTMTRRTNDLGTISRNTNYWIGEYCREIFDQDGKTYAIFCRKGLRGDTCFRAPFGQVNDMLWVREEHLITVNGSYIQCLFKDAGVIMLHFDEISPKTLINLKKRKTLGKWQRARFLPKDFARIWLEKTNTSVEKLHDISESDAQNEGVILHERGVKWLNYQDEKAKVTQFIYNLDSAKKSFLSLWGMINNCNPYRDYNPWVWVISFKVLSTTGKGAIAK